MGAEERLWGTHSDIETELLTIASHSHAMTTKLNHKNGDKTMHEDLLSNGGEKIGEDVCVHLRIDKSVNQLRIY